jgi:hypothetical protein
MSDDDDELEETKINLKVGHTVTVGMVFVTSSIIHCLCHRLSTLDIEKGGIFLLLRALSPPPPLFTLSRIASLILPPLILIPVT